MGVSPFGRAFSQYFRTLRPVFVYRFNKQSGKFNLFDTIASPDVPGSSVRFGESLALSPDGKLLVIGCPQWIEAGSTVTVLGAGTLLYPKSGRA